MITTILAEAALRSLALAVVTGLGLWLTRARSARLRNTAWALVLGGALLMPLLMQWRTVEIQAPPQVMDRAPVIVHAVVQPARVPFRPATHIEWRGYIVPGYLTIAAILLLRVITGLVLTLRVWRRASPVREPWTGGVAVRETNAIAAPATFGSGVLLPGEWREWDDLKRRAVLAHEGEHVRWGDFYVQLLSRIHVAIFWFSPLAWWLQNRLAALAEAASDDAALQAVADGPSYAEILLYFAAKPQRASAATAMARRGTISRRVERILAGVSLPSQADWKRYAVVTASVICAAALVAGCALHGQDAPPAPAALPAAPPGTPAPPAMPVSPPVALPDSPPPPQAPAPPPAGHGHSWSWNSGGGNGDSYVIVSGDSITMSGSMQDVERARRYRDKIHSDYLWYEHDGKAYLITDPALVARSKALFRQQEEIGRRQAELGEKQARLGEQQAGATVKMPALEGEVETLRAHIREVEKSFRETQASSLADSDRMLQILQKDLQAAKDKELTHDRIAELQSRVADVQAHLSEDFQSRIADLQSRLGDLQARFGELQGRAGDQQSWLGEQQSMLGEEQSKLGEEQARAAEQASRELRKIFDDALRNGQARPAE